jgi:hypothetical protein
MRRIPRWRSLALLFGFRGPSKRWLTRWEERNARASAIAEKKTAHFVRREMRAGPQPLPGVRDERHDGKNTDGETTIGRKAHTEILTVKQPYGETQEVKNG